MKNLSDAAIELLDTMCTDQVDKEIHYPDEYTAEEQAANSELGDAVRAEAKRRKLWWARGPVASPGRIQL